MNTEDNALIDIRIRDGRNALQVTGVMEHCTADRFVSLARKWVLELGMVRLSVDSIPKFSDQRDGLEEELTESVQPLQPGEMAALVESKLEKLEPPVSSRLEEIETRLDSLSEIVANNWRQLHSSIQMLSAGLGEVHAWIEKIDQVASSSSEEDPISISQEEPSDG